MLLIGYCGHTTLLSLQVKRCGVWFKCGVVKNWEKVWCREKKCGVNWAKAVTYGPPYRPMLLHAQRHHYVSRHQRQQQQQQWPGSAPQVRLQEMLRRCESQWASGRRAEWTDGRTTAEAMRRQGRRCRASGQSSPARPGPSTGRSCMFNVFRRTQRDTGTAPRRVLRVQSNKPLMLL